MHIPDGFLNIPTLIATNSLSIGTLIPAIRKINKTITPQRIPLMGLSAAFVFTAQLLSFPVIGGTSVHISGAVLISILLGPLSGLVIIFSALLLQAVIFQHGGILTLGANILNMGIIQCLGGYFIYWLFSKQRIQLGSALAAFIAKLMGSALCAIELGLSGTVPLKTGIITMVTAHTFAGIAESLTTITVLSIISKLRPDLLKLNKI